MSSLLALEPCRLIFLGAALIALFFARRWIWRQAAVCNRGEVCALPQTERVYKILFWVVAALGLAALGFPYVAPLFY